MPTFSIVVPTRERHTTLGPCLETVLAQTDPDFEVIVQDNCSSPQTAEVVESFADERIRYHRSHEPLSMKDNWELALSQVTGDYVVFLGDDDALMPECLGRARLLLSGPEAPELLCWPGHTYYWPDCADPERRNYLHLDLRSTPQFNDGWADDPFHANVSIEFPDRPHGTLYFDTERLQKTWFAWRGPRVYGSIYHNLVARSLIERVKARLGCYFLGHLPDFASLAVNLHFSKRLVYYCRPLSMSGHSGSSNGGTHGDPVKTQAMLDRFVAETRELTEELLAPGCEPLVWVPTLILGCLERVHAQLEPGEKGLETDMGAFLAYAATEVANQPASNVDTCRRWVEETAKRYDVPTDDLDFSPPERWYRETGYVCDYVGRGHAVHLDGDTAGLQNVADAVRLAVNFSPRLDVPLKLEREPEPAPEPAPPPSGRRQMLLRGLNKLVGRERAR